MQYSAESSRALTLLLAACFVVTGSLALAACGSATDTGELSDDDEVTLVGAGDTGSRNLADGQADPESGEQGGEQDETPDDGHSGPSTPPDEADTGGMFTDAGTAPDTAPDTGRTPGSGDSDTGVAPAPDTGSGGSSSPDAGSGGGNGGTGESCSGTRRMCNGTCTEMLSNPDHCGACGNACPSGAACVNGLCDCESGLNMCGGECVDLTSNDDHCFRCGQACGARMMCQNSVCVENDPEASVLKFTNEARKTPTDCGKWGLYPAGPPLTRNAELDKAAMAHAKSMAKHDFFAHKDPTDGSDFVVRVQRTNYQGTATHENIARGLRQSARRVVDGWIASDNHCRGLANPGYQEIGIAYLKLSQPNGTWDSYWVQVFGVK